MRLLEKILQNIYKNIDKIEPEEEDTPEPQEPEQEEPTSPAITKREKNPRPVVINKVRE